MKRSKLPSQTAKNISKLHQRILDLLTSEESPYKNYEIRQEYPVSSVNPNYKSNRERFDIVIKGINVCIEVHGEHHYKPTCYGGMDIEKAKREYLKRLRLDEHKARAALDAFWAFVVVSYKEKHITLDRLLELIDTALKEKPEGKQEKPKPKSKLQSRGFRKQGKQHQWPTRKIQSRSFSSLNPKRRNKND